MSRKNGLFPISKRHNMFFVEKKSSYTSKIIDEIISLQIITFNELVSGYNYNRYNGYLITFQL